LRFNVKNKDMWDFTSNLPSNSFDHDRTSFDSNRLIAEDTIRVDEHSHLTITRKVKNVFPVVVGDTRIKRCQLLLFTLPTIIYNKMLSGLMNNE
jgi:hypothetical protein